MTTMTIPFSKDELAFLDDEAVSIGKSRVDIVRDLVKDFNRQRKEAKIIAGIREAEREAEMGLGYTGDIEEILKNFKG